MGVYENINGSQIPIASNLRLRNVPIEGLVTEEELLQGLATKNDVFQYETMPTASVDLVGKVVQYVGETTASYTKGYFYECVSDGAVTPSYSWVDKSVQEGGNDTHEIRRNIFDYTDVTTNKKRSENVGFSKIDGLEDATGNWCSNQIWDIKQGDVIYTTNRYIMLLIYDEDGTLCEKSFVNFPLQYTVTNANAKYLTIQCSSITMPEYLDDVMLSINRELPNDFVPYSHIETISSFDEVENDIPLNGKAQLDKGFVVITFDAFNLDDNRMAIMNEFGFKANATYTMHPASDGTMDEEKQRQVYDAIVKNGWDCHLYSNIDWRSDASYYVDNPSTAVQEYWDNYVKDAVDYAKTQGVYNATVWGSRTNRSCVGLERACIKNGLKMVRGALPNKNTLFYTIARKDFKISLNEPSGGLTHSKVSRCIQEAQGAAQGKFGVVFTTHGLYDTAEEAEANFSLTEADLREFLTAIKTLVDAGTLEVITFRDVYRKYYQDDAADNDYERIAKTFATNADAVVKTSALPTASADFLNQTYLLTSPQTGYTEGGIYKCVAKGTNPETYEWKMINATDPNTVLAPKTTSEGTYNRPYYPEHVTITPQQDGSVNCETDDSGAWAGATFDIDISLDVPTLVEFPVTALEGSTLPSAFQGVIYINRSTGYYNMLGSMSVIDGKCFVYIADGVTAGFTNLTTRIEIGIVTNQHIGFNVGKPTSTYGNTDTIYNSLYKPLFGKKAIFLGDSITALTGSRGWVDNFCALTSCKKVANVAVSSAVLNDYEDTVYDGDPKSSVQHNNTLGNQVQKIINNAYEAPDLIVIAIGTNGGITADSTRLADCYDATNSGGTWSLPDIANIDRTHSEGAFRYCNEKLHSLYPNAIICWCNPIQRSAGSAFTTRSQVEWCNNLKTLTNFGGVLNIETNRCGIMTANETFGANGEDLADGLHPNSNGAMKMARYNAAAISKLFV